MSSAATIKAGVKAHYERALERGPSGCCGGSPELVKLAGYEAGELAALPGHAAAQSFGCGNPLSFAEVEPGQVVVDVGSGAGIDCFLASAQVGPEGKVIGIDMTPAMIDRARANARTSTHANVEFRLGEAEAMPVADSTADWIVSNCVINLSPDKRQVFREAYRVLKPGGRLAISDIVAELPRALRWKSLYGACLSGALPEGEYLKSVAAAGFVQVEVAARRTYDLAQLAALFGEGKWWGRAIAKLSYSPLLAHPFRRLVERVASVHVRAVKPLSGARG
jgi:SAM-dependent methyltransferase